jgi:hypothetical protein
MPAGVCRIEQFLLDSDYLSKKLIILKDLAFDSLAVGRGHGIEIEIVGNVRVDLLLTVGCGIT